MKIPKIHIGLINPKTPENVSRVMRAAGNFRVDRVLYTGERYPRAVRLNPDIPNISRPVSEHIPLTGVDDLFVDMPENMQIVCVEFAENARPLPAYVHPHEAFYIFGPEDGTISQAIIDRADAVVYVPTNGCLNLAATVNVVLYDRLMKATEGFASNDLIRQNRCRNNNVKVKNKKVNENG